MRGDFMIKMALMALFLFLMIGCGLEDEPRTLSEAHTIANASDAFDQVYFVVKANCDYDFFFEYEPMRRGGFYAVGVLDGNPQLMIIPVIRAAEVKSDQWPLLYSVDDAIDLLNTLLDTPKDHEDMYTNIVIELTDAVLNENSHTMYDQSFFIVMQVEATNYIAFQKNHQLVIYHEDNGFMVSN